MDRARTLLGKVRSLANRGSGDPKVRRLREQLKRRDREISELRARLDGKAPSAGPPVFFVIGRAKSGTSWLMRLLDVHPEILCKGEGRFFGRDFIREEFMKPDQKRIQPSSLYRAFLEADYLKAWIQRSVWSRGDDPEEHLKELTRVATDHFLTRRLAKTGKRIVGDKTPLLGTEIVREMHEIYPEARVIHIIRDGRDAAVSMTHHMWNHAQDREGVYNLKPEELKRRESFLKSYEQPTGTRERLFTDKDLRDSATGWRNQIQKSREYGRTLFGDVYAEVRYEDLLERPNEETERLLRFLGADASAGTVEECVRAASFETWTKGRRRGEEDPSSFFRKGVAGDWRNVFTEEDKDVFKEVAGDLLVDLGYEKDRDW